MTNQASPGRLPAHDLSAFDLSKRSPEQVAQSFARWKAQRKQQAEAGPVRADPLPSPKPAGTDEAAAGPTRRASAKPASSLRYSEPFSDLLAAGSEPTVQRTEWPPVAAMRPPQRMPSPGRRLKVMSILAGAASVFALAGGALLELADWRDPAEVAPQVAQVRPKETPMALAAVATSVPAVEWTLQRTVDVALMKAAPAAVRQTPKPPTPAIQTASKTVPVAGDKPVTLPERKSAAPETVQFVAKPYVPNIAPMPVAQETAPIPAPPKAVTVPAGDPRPDDLFQHGRDNRDGAVSNRTASSGKPAAAAGTGSTVDARSAGARKVTSGGSVDPRGEGSGGARVGTDGEVGTPSDAGGGGVSAGNSGTSDAGDVSGDGGASGGGSRAGAADGGDTSAGAGDGGAGDSGAGGDDTSAGAGDSGTGDTGAGSGDTGGDESGDASDGSSGDRNSDAGEDGESGGIGGAVGGALGGVGDALGGVLGGDSNPDDNNKDQRD